MAFESLSGATMFSLAAGADLSSNQYQFVKLNSSAQVVLCAAATDVPIGILQNKPKSGQAADVMMSGISKVVASAALTVGNLVGTDSSGKAAAYVNGTDTTKVICGQVLSATGATNGIATVAINCITPNRGA